MATYLQGVTDYIPQYQPFQPDLNFYGNVLQTKQTQYDTNWKALNKMYNQYYNAPLTRDNNIAKKDNYLNQIEFNLQRVSQLDLSLEQNVDQATQIFKPFYEDKDLMVDMAFTKNNMSETSYGESLKNAYDAKQKEQYWSTGIQKLQYEREEFKEASAEDARNMRSSKYTPNVNVYKLAEKIVKDAGLTMSSVSTDGIYKITTTNGEQITEPLEHLLEASLGNDPAVQDVYMAQAYVNRKDYAYANAANFGGDKNAAEMVYLEDNFKILKSKSDMRYLFLKEKSIVNDSKIQDLKKQIDNKTAGPGAKIALEQLKINKEINDQILERTEKQQEELSVGENRGSLSTGFVNPYKDIKSLRYKVDSGAASFLINKDLKEYSSLLSYKGYKQTSDVDPVALLRLKEESSMRVKAFEASLKEKQSTIEAINKTKIDNGTHRYDELGELVPIDDQFYVRDEDFKAGNSTDAINIKEKSRSISNLTKKEYLDPYMKSTFSILDAAMKDDKISKQDIGKILNYKENSNVSLDDFINKYNTYGDAWIRKHVGKKGIAAIQKNMTEWVNSNINLELFTQNGTKTNLYNSYRKSNSQLENYKLYIKTDTDSRINNSKAVVNHLTSRLGLKGANLLYDKNGETQTEDEYNKALSKQTNNAFSKVIKDKEQYEKDVADTKWKLKLAKEKNDGNAYYNAKERLKKLEKVAAYNNDFELPKEYNYKELIKAAGQAYSNPKIVKASTARIPSLSGSGTGLSTKGSVINVNPKGNTPGRIHFAEVYQDIMNNFDWNGNTDKVTYQGIGKSNYDGTTSNKSKAAKTILEALWKETNNPKTKLGVFDIASTSIAAGSSTKGAYIIKPTKEFLDQFTGEEGKALITPTERNYLMTNGIAFIMDNKKMNSTLYKQSYKSPLQSYIDTYKKYELTNINGDPLKSYTITPNTLGTGDYSTTITWGTYEPNNPEANKDGFVSNSYTNNVGFQGGNLEYNMDIMLTKFMDSIDYSNAINYNNY